MLIDRETVRAVKEGSVRAFEELYDSYVNRVYRFLLTMLRSAPDAREATQDIFVRLWDARHQLDENRDISPYLFTISRNHALNIIRKRKRQAELAQEYYREEAQTASPADDTNRYMALLEKAIETLPPRRKKIFELCKLEGMSYKQVAAMMKLSDGTVEVQVTRALKDIRSFMATNNSR